MIFQVTVQALTSLCASHAYSVRIPHVTSCPFLFYFVDAVQPSLCFHIASYGIESVFKGFLFLILVHASTEISKYIWSILVFFLMRYNS
uniref:Uncharacterized protein n=1 Tax=Triticum urartu TaxID=4572 RepID=A0A8R7QEB7_TRIUA